MAKDENKDEKGKTTVVEGKNDSVQPGVTAGNGGTGTKDRKSVV